jgi:ankyrin repeat protein
MQFEVAILQILDESGVEVQANDQEGKTLLHHAAMFGSVSVALLHYLEQFPQLNFEASDHTGKTAIDYAYENAQSEHHRQMFRRDGWEQTIAVFTEFGNYPLTSTTLS